MEDEEASQAAEVSRHSNKLRGSNLTNMLRFSSFLNFRFHSLLFRTLVISGGSNLGRGRGGGKPGFGGDRGGKQKSQQEIFHAS